MSAEAIYLGTLGIFLVLMRSPWPWTRAGGAVLGLLVVGAAAATLGSGESVDARWTDVGPTASLALALFAALLLWTSLHQAHRPRPVELGPSASRLRWFGLAGALVLVAAAADLLGAPTVGGASAPWFLAGLVALAPMTGATFSQVMVPVAALVGLLVAPDLDQRDSETPAPAHPAPGYPAPGPSPAGSNPEGTAAVGALGTGVLPTPAAFEGRRDEVPFFLFAWLSVGVVPIVLAAWRPEFGQLELVNLSERFWVDGLGRPSPSAWWLRELPGLALYLALFVGLPLRLPTWKASKGVFGRHLRRLGAVRYGLLMAITGALVLVPVKVLFAWLWGIGPWIVVGGLQL
ncbi:MAG: hypothetical protein AAGM22_26835 [Acidobacteriota bacterium]